MCFVSSLSLEWHGCPLSCASLQCSACCRFLLPVINFTPPYARRVCFRRKRYPRFHHAGWSEATTPGNLFVDLGSPMRQWQRCRRRQGGGRIVGSFDLGDDGHTSCLAHDKEDKARVVPMCPPEVRRSAQHAKRVSVVSWSGAILTCCYSYRVGFFRWSAKPFDQDTFDRCARYTALEVCSGPAFVACVGK